MVKVLMLSKWHVHAVDYARAISSQEDSCISCVWDEDTKRGTEWAKELNVPFEGDLEKALGRSGVDAVVVCTPTNDHRRVMTAAAKAGKHIYTEKVLASTLEDCKAIAEEVKKSGVKFCISFPQLTNPIIQYAKEAIEQNWLGKLHYLRIRNSHAGTLMDWLPKHWYDAEKACGGAMMDLGCHPLYIASHLLGKPSRVASIFNNNLAPQNLDDNAVSVVEFENKVIAVLETSFISPHHNKCFELLGTEGAIVQINNDIKVRSKHFKEGWFIPDRLPNPLNMPIRFWLDGITKGSNIPYDLEKAISLTELMENAYISDREQRIVKID